MSTAYVINHRYAPQQQLAQRDETRMLAGLSLPECEKYMRKSPCDAPPSRLPDHRHPDAETQVQTLRQPNFVTTTVINWVEIKSMDQSDSLS